MSTENLEVIEKLASIIGSSSEYVINEYSVWFIASAICWSIFGAAIIFVMSRVQLPEDWYIHPLVIKGVMFFIGGVFIAANLPDLASPQGVAINQLLYVLRG